MHDIIDIKNLTLACMLLNMGSIIVCVAYMLYTKQSIINLLMESWDSDDLTDDHEFVVPREGRFARRLNTMNNPPLYDYYLSTPITDETLVRGIIKHDRIIHIRIDDDYNIVIMLNPVWINDAKTLSIIDSLVDDLWVKLIELKCKQKIDETIKVTDSAFGKISTPTHRFVDSCTGPFYDFKLKPTDELCTKPTAPTGMFHNDKPRVDTVSSPKINQSIWNDPEIDQISDKTSAEVDRPKVEI